MTDWTAGYVADIDYTYGYYGELNPLRARLALLHKGYAIPEFKTACELGFGQGLSANIHAAASNATWYGTDFNPAQAAYAQSLSNEAGLNAKLYDQSFEEFANRTDLPEFDFICLHGIWSWISDENRQVLVKFIRNKLAVGGVLYISYNTMPGWANFAPMRHLMLEHVQRAGAESHGIVGRINGAIEFASKLIAVNPHFLRVNPAVADRIEKIKKFDRHYLAHEYFNRDWHPMHFATLAESLQPAKVQYACSAVYLELVEALNFTPEQLEFFNQIPDPLLRESVRDFLVNQQFRRDYWIKGARKLSLLEQSELLRKEKVVLTTCASDVGLTLQSPAGEADLNTGVYVPLLDLLADYKPKTIGQIEVALKDKGIGIAQIINALLILTGSGHINPAQDEQLAQKARKHCDKLNTCLKHNSRGRVESNYLASPVLGGGFGVGRFQQMFLLAIEQGLKQPEEWAKYAWSLIGGLNERIVKDGKVIETAADNLAEMTRQAKDFAEKQLPILKALQIN